MLRLFHVSDRSEIERFDPRPAPNNPTHHGDVVWAVDETHLPNYLLPRDCPRVCFAAGALTSEDDQARFLPGASASSIIAVEESWRERILHAALYLYELPVESFVSQDGNAGYYVSMVPVAPAAVIKLDDLLGEIASRNVELRFLRDLWPLHDAVAKSTLAFSMIRMRNAQPRKSVAQPTNSENISKPSTTSVRTT